MGCCNTFFTDSEYLHKTLFQENLEEQNNSTCLQVTHERPVKSDVLLNSLTKKANIVKIEIVQNNPESVARLESFEIHSEQYKDTQNDVNSLNLNLPDYTSDVSISSWIKD